AAKHIPEQTQKLRAFRFVLADVDGDDVIRAGSEVTFRGLNGTLPITAQGAVVEVLAAILHRVDYSRHGARGAHRGSDRGQVFRDLPLTGLGFVFAHAAVAREDDLPMFAGGNDVEFLRPRADVLVDQLLHLL